MTDPSSLTNHHRIEISSEFAKSRLDKREASSNECNSTTGIDDRAQWQLLYIENIQAMAVGRDIIHVSAGRPTAIVLRKHVFHAGPIHQPSLEILLQPTSQCLAKLLRLG